MSWNKEVLKMGTGAENEQGERLRGEMNRIESNSIYLMSRTRELKNGHKIKNWNEVTNRAGV